MLLIAVAFVLGTLIGFAATNFILRHETVGTLRIDTSDSEDGPYMFLEIDKGVGDISSRRYILLRVSLQSYLSRK